jgi:subtilisin family serine protease
MVLPRHLVAGLAAPAVIAVTALGGPLHVPATATHSSPATVMPDDPYFRTGPDALSGGQWGAELTAAPAAWALTTGSPTVTIAIIDSGVAASQPDLRGRLVPGHNVLTGTSDTADTAGHGTEVAGVAAGTGDNGFGGAGYCWSCRIMPVKVYATGSARERDIANGITWAVDHGADVINVSLSGTAPTRAMASAVAYALGRGVLVVAAAGNNGTANPTYPAALPGVISVTGTDPHDVRYPYADYGSWVQLAAPGTAVTTLPDGGFGAVGGTSVASPAVAGIVGLMLAADPTATPARIVHALYASADPTAEAGITVHGRVNAYRALRTLLGGA